MKKFINGWTRESFLAKLEEKNGWSRCGNADSGAFLCKYRDNRGFACAVGAFIPDDYGDLEHVVSMNISVSCGFLNRYPDLEQFMPLEKTDLITLQEMHDIRDKEWSRKAVENFIDEI